MKCPICQREGQRSIVTERQSQTTLMNVVVRYDEDGRRMVSDPNIITIMYECSRGHRFQRRVAVLAGGA